MKPTLWILTVCVAAALAAARPAVAQDNSLYHAELQHNAMLPPETAPISA